MQERKNNRYIGVLIIDVLLALFLWVLLIVLRASGVVSMHWALVLSSLVWLSWALFALTALAGAVKWLLAKLKRWYRSRKRDRRIIRQAKATGVWDLPWKLGGRALELKAWQEYKIKRKPGETDACLRIRCNACHSLYVARRDKER